MCVTWVLKLVITLINSVFVIVSLLLIGFGFLLKHGADSGVLKTIQDDILTQISSTSSTLGLGAVDTSEFNITDLTGGLGQAMIVLGFFFLAVSVAGFIGGCCTIKILLWIYIFTILVLILAQIIGFALIMEKDAISSTTKSGLRTTIKSDYRGLTGQNLQSLAWNFVMKEYKCCGVDSYTDFSNGTQWNGTLSDTSGNTVYVNMPLICCKTFPTTWTAAGVACATAASTDNYKNTGCYDAVYNMVLGDTKLVVLVFLAAIGIQIVLILFAYFIIRENSKVSQVV